jgi:hypothetical protein
MVAVLAFVAVVRLRLLDFPLERDEGEYAYAGQLMLQGVPPYELAYNMKFPGTYAAYALIMAVFGQTPAGIHLGVLCMITLTALMLYWLGKKILDETAGIVAATAYAILAASPSMLGLAGHATHFVAFFITAGLCVMWRARQDGSWFPAFASGLLFGTAILMKQHAAIIAAWAGLSFAIACGRKSGQPWSRRLVAIAACALGVITPFGLCCLILWHAGVFGTFWFWTVDYARQYTSVVALSEASGRFWRRFPWVVSTTALLWLLAAAGAGLMWFDERLKPARLWLLGFSLVSALTIVPGFYFRPHYFLVTLPALALLAGCAISVINGMQKQADNQTHFRSLLMLVYMLFLAAIVFINSDIWIRLNPLQAAREVYGREPFPEAQAVADYIRTHTLPEAKVVVLGSEPEIYFLAHRHSATGYIYTYALLEAQPFALTMQDEMIGEIQTHVPEFIVYIESATSWGIKPDPNTRILTWWKSYKTNYVSVTLDGILSSTNYMSGGVSNFGKPSSQTNFDQLAIFRRKPEINHPWK